MRRILVVEDDLPLRVGIVAALSRDFAVTTADRGDTGLIAAKKERPDLVLLDIGLPAMDGLDVLRQLRKAGCEMPVIMLSVRSDEIDKVVGLELGADDYITKPFGAHELVARVRACLRRYQRGASLTGCRFGDVDVDFEKKSIHRAGKRIQLTPKEFELLEFMIEHCGWNLTRDEILQQVWGMHYYGTTRTVDTHIFSLRRALEPNPSEPSYIQTVHGEGYRFSMPSPES